MVSDAAPPSPTYADIGHAVRVLDGVPAKRPRDLMNAIFEQAGSSPRSIDWSDPDRWIDERLAGDLRKLARKVWEESGKTLNPRYLYGHYAFINRLKLSCASSWPCGRRGAAVWRTRRTEAEFAEMRTDGPKL